eukprot:Polyplicarium_translucidae@DN5270_c0_g1_i1.p2
MEDFVTRHCDTLKTIAIAGPPDQPPPSQWPVGRTSMRDFPLSLVEAALPWKHVACHVMENACQWRPRQFEFHNDDEDSITAVVYGETLDSPTVQIVSFPHSPTLEGIKDGLSGMFYNNNSTCFALTRIGELGRPLPFLKAEPCRGCQHSVAQLRAGLSLIYRMQSRSAPSCSTFSAALAEEGFRCIREKRDDYQWVNVKRAPTDARKREEEALIPAVVDCSSY